MQKSQKSSPSNDHAYSSYDQLESPISQSKTIQASFTFKETPDPVIENELKMPLVFLPQSSPNNIWNNIASDILRSIHSEYSFAKKSELKFEKKTKNLQCEKTLEKFTTEPSSYKSENPLKKTHLSPIKIQIDSLRHINLPSALKKTKEIDCSNKNIRKISNNTHMILKTRKNDENTLNHSWEQLHSDIVDDFDNNAVNESEEHEKIIERIRRKSCHCSACGQMSTFQKKTDFLLGDFPTTTRYLQKKLEKQKLLLEMEKEKMKSSVILKFQRKPKTNITTRKENTTLLLLKNSNKSSSTQIKNLINSSLKASTIRRSGIGQFEEKTNENIEMISPPVSKKKTMVSFEESGEKLEKNKPPPIKFDKKNSSEDEVFLNSTDRIEKDAADLIEKPDVKDLDDFLNDYAPARRVTCDVPKKKNLEELKTTSALLRRAKTFKEKDKTSNTSKSVIDHAQIDLQKNIELVYNQFSPTKLHAINILNSPSDRTRTHASYKRNYFSVGGRVASNFSNVLEEQNKISNENKEKNGGNSEIMRENQQDELKNNENFKLSLKKPETIGNNPPSQEEFHNLLKKNTPKYLLFKQNYREKLVGEARKSNNGKDPLGRIYQSKMLMKLLMQQKQQTYFPMKNAISCSFGNKKPELSENHENSQISKNPSNFKIRNIANLSAATGKNNKKKGSTHRKNKSTAAEAFVYK